MPSHHYMQGLPRDHGRGTTRVMAGRLRRAACLLIVAGMALAQAGPTAACGCDPENLDFQDTFFKYCDAARAAYEAEAALASGLPAARAAVGFRPVAGHTAAPEPQPVSSAGHQVPVTAR